MTQIDERKDVRSLNKYSLDSACEMGVFCIFSSSRNYVNVLSLTNCKFRLGSGLVFILCNRMEFKSVSRESDSSLIKLKAYTQENNLRNYYLISSSELRNSFFNYADM